MSARWVMGVATTAAGVSVEEWRPAFEAHGVSVAPLTDPDEGEAQLPDVDALCFVLERAIVAAGAELEPALMAITAQINQLHEVWHQRRPGDVRVPVVLLISIGDAAAAQGLTQLGPLVGRSVAYLRSRSLDEFVEGVCGQVQVVPHATTLRPWLQRLSMLLDFLMTLEIDFQIVVGAAPGAADAPEGVRRLVAWTAFTLQRERAFAWAGRLRAQFVVVALVAFVVASLPFLVDGLRARDSLSAMVEKGATPRALALALEADAASLGVRALDAIALPGTAAQSTARRTARLVAAWKAHAFLRERVGRAPVPDSLRTWSEKLGRGTPSGQELFDGWRDLPAPERELVRSTVRWAVLRHDLVVTAEVERLVGGYSLRSGVDATEPLIACQRLAATFVLPIDADPELRRLGDRLDRRCDVLTIEPNTRALVLTTDRWREQVEEAFAAGAVTEARVGDWIARAPRVPGIAVTGSAIELRRREREVVLGQLEQVRTALAAQRSGDVELYASELARLLTIPAHGVATIEAWARRRAAEAGGAASG